MDDNIILVDAEAGSKRVMLNYKLYAKLLGKFLDDPAYINLNNALTAGDMEKAQSSIHALKGLSANLSLIELNNQSIKLEAQIKAGSVDPELVEYLKNIYAQTKIEIEKVITRYV